MRVDQNENLIVELQILIMDQQRAMETLSDQLITQASRIDSLQTQLSKFESKLTQLTDTSPDQISSQDQKPPHY